VRMQSSAHLKIGYKANAQVLDVAVIGDDGQTLGADIGHSDLILWALALRHMKCMGIPEITKEDYDTDNEQND
jgi:hypothetical protein